MRTISLSGGKHSGHRGGRASACLIDVFFLMIRSYEHFPCFLTMPGFPRRHAPWEACFSYLLLSQFHVDRIMAMLVLVVDGRRVVQVLGLTKSRR